MAILITGITGFLGSHLAEKFCEKGETVIGLKRKSSDLTRINALKDKIILYCIDSMNISNILFEHNIEFVIHTATSYGDINQKSLILASNFELPKLLLDQCLLQKKNIKFINISTFFCKKIDISTIELSEKHSAYIFTKKLFEYYGMIKSTNEYLSFLDVKLEHVYGPNDNVENKFIPLMIKSMLANKNEIELSVYKEMEKTE